MDISGLNMNLTNRENWVAVIGSREATPEELNMAYLLGYELIRQGYIVVSGLALGIDAKAHAGALARLKAMDNNDLYKYGRVVAIVNTPKNQPIYPSANRALAKEIRTYGCILHPYNTIAESRTGFNQFKKRLIERDLILAKLCPKIIAVSDKEVISGGTRYAVHYGKHFGKEVYRLDSQGNYYLNPPTEYCNVNWKMEFDLDAI